MLQKQISVFVENQRGRLADVTQCLGDNGIDLSALSIADTADFGILRLIVDKPEQAERALRDSGFAVSVTEVISLSVDDRPGGLAAALSVMDSCGIDIDYMYAFIKRNEDKAMVIVRVDKPAEAVELLRGTPIGLPSVTDAGAATVTDAGAAPQ